MSRRPRLASRLRRISGVGEAELMPQARLSGPMPWVIAIMVALTVIAVAAGLSLRNAAQAAAAELSGGVTVQIVQASPTLRQQQTERAAALLRGLPEVVSLRVVPRGELEALIEPWLGSAMEELPGSDAETAVPVPSLIDVRMRRAVTPERLQMLRNRLRPVAPSARIDAQSTWLKPVFDAFASLQWLALALVLLLGGALSAAVLLASRSALGANRDTIEIVHLLGGTDAQIARVFQRSIGTDAAGGGLLGLLLAAIVVLFFGQRFAGLGAGMVNSGALALQDWLSLALVPVLAVMLAMLTARFTVMHALRKML